jgi:hypothetical protein
LLAPATGVDDPSQSTRKSPGLSPPLLGDLLAASVLQPRLLLLLLQGLSTACSRGAAFLPVEYSLLVGFSFNELNQKKTMHTQAITVPPDEVFISAQRIFRSSVHLGQYFFEETYFRRN